MASLIPPAPIDYEIKPCPTSILQQTVLDIEAPWKDNEKKEKGICLTWKDLWVSASMVKHGSKPILQGLTGYAKPGQLLAIMGPSGCGKSTLLDALAGRLSSKTKQTGEILVNGNKQALAYGTSAYVTQDDTLMTTLTVREAVHYSAKLQLPDTLSKEEKKERAEFTIREMGLQDVVNTRIGGWGIKGISGGQKRRVSICIEILTRPKLLFLDEPTSGLDSAASYYVMKRISTLDKKDGIQRTIIASIHQPSSEVFQLFHNLFLLSFGSTVYFGPASAASEDIEVGFAGTRTIPTEEAIHILLSSYKSSKWNHEVQNEVAILSEKDTNPTNKRRKHADFLNQCLVLTKRSSVNMFRDLGYYWLRLAVYIALATSLATVFYDLGTTYGSIKDRISLLMFVSTFITMMTIGGFPSYVEDMKAIQSFKLFSYYYLIFCFLLLIQVFERERLNGHYGVTAYVIGNTFSSIPYLLLVTIIPGVITYYPPGLQKGYVHFLYFLCVLFSCLMIVESLMMVVASIVPNFLMGIITGVGIQGIMILGGGFFKLPNDLPKPFWRYPLHYVAFHRYAYQGMFKNEFEGLKFATNNEVCGGGSSSNYISGEEILRNEWQVDLSHSKWVDLGILLAMIVLSRVLFLVIVKTTKKVKPIVASFLSAPPKKSIQIMENPNVTPLNL
ncbi:ABC transporter G family member 1-like isoform X2 [Lotus japonicus]|uniref:ABC transporter G family member 1-like isoform X2 n=1 Tax=Lotus japonicus TaxID=34305 RepID=UPI00258DDCCB|nr:ABC transporter G family member 1-like isoform X2 [Lotus japonicus]